MRIVGTDLVPVSEAAAIDVAVLLAVIAQRASLRDTSPEYDLSPHDWRYMDCA